MEHVHLYEITFWIVTWARAPFEVKTSAKDVQEHDLTDGSEPRAVGGHLEEVICRRSF